MKKKVISQDVQFILDKSKAPKLIHQEKKTAREGVLLSTSEQDYLLPHFTMIVVGKPGSGKTTVIRDLLTSKQFYKKKFDHVLLVSPSANKMDIPVSKENMNQVFSLKWIEERLLEFNKKQTQRIIQRLRDKGVIDKFDVKKLNGHLFDEMATDVTKNQPNLRNIFEDKERFFTTGLFDQQTRLKHPATQKMAPSNSKYEEVKSDGKGKSLQHLLPRYVDEIHEKYVKKMTIEDRNDLLQNCLIVLDDVVSDLKANEHNPMLTQLIFNRRHLYVNGTVSIIIVSQKYSMIPSRVRSNASWMILFKMNPVDAEAVYKDAIDWPLELWTKLLEYVYGGVEKKTHNQLGIWVEQNKFFLNFSEIKLSSGIKPSTLLEDRQQQLPQARSPEREPS